MRLHQLWKHIDFNCGYCPFQAFGDSQVPDKKLPTCPISDNTDVN